MFSESSSEPSTYLRDLFETPNYFGEVPELHTKRFQKILVVEDNQDLRQALAEFLGQEGYFVATARNGQDGLLQLLEERDPPDLILLDMKMPVKDGRQFLKEKSEIEELRGIPVVIISGELSVEELRNLPARGCMQKPFDWNDVLETVKLCSQKTN
jgi:two-component system, chemotaxis family, chemotaxis protein CheY